MNGYKDLSKLSTRIFSYPSPCQIEPESIILIPKSPEKSFLKVTYHSKSKVIISLFFNVTETENQ